MTQKAMTPINSTKLARRMAERISEERYEAYTAEMLCLGFAARPTIDPPAQPRPELGGQRGNHAKDGKQNQPERQKATAGF